MLLFQLTKRAVRLPPGPHSDPNITLGARSAADAVINGQYRKCSRVLSGKGDDSPPKLLADASAGTRCI